MINLARRKVRRWHILAILFVVAVITAASSSLIVAQESSGEKLNAESSPSKDDRIFVQLLTSEGEIVLLLDEKRAPITVENFLNYVEKGHYDGTIFHRVLKDFMIQGGGYDKDKTNSEKTTDKEIKNEAGNGLSNQRYTVAMARKDAPDSASAQFFINTASNFSLDRKNAPDGFGYTVFGKVVKGISTVDRIAAVAVQRPKNSSSSKEICEPIKQVIIEKAQVVVPMKK